MTITLRLTDILLIILTLSVVGVAVYFMIVLRKLGKVLAETERTLGRAGELMPKLEAVAGRLQETLASVQKLADESTRAVGDVAAVTSVARAVVEESAEQVSGLLSALKQAGTVLNSFRAGWDFFSKKCEDETEDQEESKE